MLSPNRARRTITKHVAIVKRQQQAHRNGTLNFRADRRGRMGEVCWSPNNWTVCCSYPGLPTPICAHVITG